MHVLHFSKYQSSGNDLILIADFDKKFPAANAAYIKRLCNRKFGIGSDGLVLLEKKGSNFSMRFFNPDGAEAAQCGNALLCLGAFIRTLSVSNSPYLIETKAGARTVRFHENKILASLGTPSILHWDLPFVLGPQTVQLSVVNTGVPHAVLLRHDKDFINESRVIRSHEIFHPEGVNVNFAEVADEKKIKLRTFERGVEDETFSCGTGAAAAAFVLGKQNGWKGKVEVAFSSGEKLDVFLSEQVEIAGEPVLVFKGLL